MAALHRPVLVENDHRHVLDVVVERVAESDHLNERREEHEEERHRVAQDDDELLEKDGAEAAKGRLIGRARSFDQAAFSG